MKEKFDPDPRVKRTVHDGREVEAAGHMTFSQEAEKNKTKACYSSASFLQYPSQGMTPPTVGRSFHFN